MLPLISILIPCYNGEKFIHKCLDSCIEQTYTNIEIIVINDGSTDSSQKILDSLAKTDKRIKILSQTNKGLGETRNRLIASAKGQYFYFVDIDDIIPIRAIELLQEGSNNGKINLIVGYTAALISKFKLPFFPTSWRTWGMTEGHFVKSNVCPPWGVLINTEFFKKQKIQFIPNEHFEDLGVMPYLYLVSNGKFKFIRHCVYQYRLSNNNSKLSSFNDKCQSKIYSIYMQYLQLMSYLAKQGMHQDKEYKRYINGALYQVSISIAFLSNHLHKKSARIKFDPFQLTPRYNLLLMYRKYGYKKVKFSKTFWKSLAFFCIGIWYRSSYKYFKRNENPDFMTFMNEIVIKNRYKYNLVSFENSDSKIEKKQNIIFIRFDEISKFIKSANENPNKYKKDFTILIDISRKSDLLFFVKEHYEFFNLNKFLIGIKFNKLTNYDIFFKYFSFIYSNDRQAIQNIQKKSLKILTMSSDIKEKSLVNFVVNNSENI